MTNNCDIQIELGEDNPTYQAGDTIRGAVRVEVNTDCRCDDLTLSLEWYTHGRGNTVERRVDQQSLFQGEWTAGGYHFYNFEITVPPGPYTYHGTYLNVDWRLRARADIPWAMDPTDEQEVLLEPSGNEQSFRNVGDRTEDTFPSTNADQPVSLWGILFAAFFLIGGLLVLPAAIVSEKPTAWLAAIGFLGGGGFILFRSIRNALAERRLGDVNVHLVPTEAHPGASLRCRVDVEPSDPVDLNKIIVLLRGYEQVVSGQGTSETTHTHTVHAERKTLDGSKQATIREGLHTFETDIALPDSAPFSFHADDNELRWEVKARIDLPRWPDWSHTEPLTVRP